MQKELGELVPTKPHGPASGEGPEGAEAPVRPLTGRRERTGCSVRTCLAPGSRYLRPGSQEAVLKGSEARASLPCPAAQVTESFLCQEVCVCSCCLSGGQWSHPAWERKVTCGSVGVSLAELVDNVDESLWSEDDKWVGAPTQDLEGRLPPRPA